MATYLSCNMADAPSATLPTRNEDAIRASYFAALRAAAAADGYDGGRSPVLARPAPGPTHAPIVGVIYRVEGPGLPRPRFFGDAHQAEDLARARGGVVYLPSGAVIEDYRPETPAARESRLAAARSKSAGQAHRQAQRAADDAALKAKTFTGGYRSPGPDGPDHRGKGKKGGGKNRR